MTLEKGPQLWKIESLADASNPALLCRQARALLAVARPLQEPGRDELVRLVDVVWAKEKTLSNELLILEQKRAKASDAKHSEHLISVVAEELREHAVQLHMWARGYLQGYTTNRPQ